MATYIPPITKLSSVVTRILGCNPGPLTLQGTNTYLLGSGKKRILIDTGERNKPEYIDNLKNVLLTENAILEHVILSHWHSDHIGGVHDIFISMTMKDCKVWKYKRTGGSEANLDNIRLNVLQNNQEFIIDGATLRIIHTPGHTTDHIIVELKEENAIFGGDCILGEGTSVFEDLHEYLLSLKKILNLNPSIIYPGHGPVINNVIEKVQYYIDHRIQRENSILSLLSSTKDTDQSWTETEIVRKLYTNVPENLQKIATINVINHLKKLLKEDKVIFRDEKWKIKSYSE